jgi:chromosome segregation ATPase
MYVKICESSESQAVIVNRALEQYFTPSDDTQTQPENEYNSNLQATDIARCQENVIIELQNQIKAKDDLITVNETHHLNRIEDLKNNIYLLDNQLRTKDDQIEKLNENMHKQAVHIQSLIQENSKLNSKLLPDNTENKKSWWRFW